MYEPGGMFRKMQNKQIISRVMYNVTIFYFLEKEEKLSYISYKYTHICMSIEKNMEYWCKY